MNFELRAISLSHIVQQLQVLRSLDDHADLLSVQVHTNCELFGGKKNQKNTTRNLVLSRFWKLDDDGVYLIAINSAKEGDFSHLKVRIIAAFNSSIFNSLFFLVFLKRWQWMLFAS